MGWPLGLVRLYWITDLLIGISFFIIPYILFYIVRKRKDIPFTAFFWWFMAFILGCGLTHIVGAIEFWYPIYGIGAICNVITMMTAWGTIVSMVPALPKILALRSPSELESAYQELSKVRGENEQLIANLQTRVDTLQSFNYVVCHDLNAPMRSMDGFSQILLEDYANRLDDLGKDYLRRIRLATVRMRQLIRDVLRLATVTGTNSSLHIMPVNLSFIVDSILDNYKMDSPNRSIQFKIQKDIYANCDKEFITLALANMLDNAWKFSSKKEDTIKDNGAGFNMKDYHHLFEPFQRLHAQAEFEGNGVGLTVVKRVIDLHKGQIWAEGEVGKGATFYFTLGT
jgi:signal transduction histidine kinase